MFSTIAATLLRNIDQFPRNFAATVFPAFSCFRSRKRHPGLSCPGRLDRLFGLIVFGSRIIARLIRRRGNGIPIGLRRRRLGRRCRCRRRGRCRGRCGRGRRGRCWRGRGRGRRGRRRCRGRCRGRRSTSGGRGVESRRSRLLLTREHKRQNIVGILIGPLAGIARGPVANGAILEHLAKHSQEHRDKGNDHQEQNERDAAALDDCLYARRARIVAIIAVAANPRAAIKPKRAVKIHVIMFDTMPVKNSGRIEAQNNLPRLAL